MDGNRALGKIWDLCMIKIQWLLSILCSMLLLQHKGIVFFKFFFSLITHFIMLSVLAASSTKSFAARMLLLYAVTQT